MNPLSWGPGSPVINSLLAPMRSAPAALLLGLAVTLLPSCLPANLPLLCVTRAGKLGRMIEREAPAMKLRGGQEAVEEKARGGKEAKMTDEEAMKELESLLDACRNGFSPEMRRALELSGLGDDASLEEDQEFNDVKEAFEMFPQHMPTVYKYARALHMRGMFDEAIREYKAAAACEHRGQWNETLAHTYCNHGLILQAQKENYTEAEAMYRAALELSPDHIPALANLARLYDGGNTRAWNTFTSSRYTDDLNPNGAEELYRRVLELEPLHESTLVNYAYFLETKRQRFEEARAMYMTALDMFPNNTILLRNWAGYLCNVEEPYDPDTLMPVYFNQTCNTDDNWDPRTTLPINPAVDRPVDRARAVYLKVMQIEPPTINGFDPVTKTPLPEYRFHLMHGLFCPTVAPDIQACISEEEAAAGIEYLKHRLERAQNILKKSQGASLAKQMQKLSV